MVIKKGKFISTYYADKRRCFLSDNEKTYFCKNGTGSKDLSVNPKIWLLNEIIYSIFADKIDVPVPELKFFEHNETLYIGSEYLPERIAYNIKPDPNVFKSLPNKIVFTKIFLLDIFLFNSDRFGWNILVDKTSKVWAIDHDKCFVGDGKNDLHRFTNLPEKRLQYIMDYSPYKNLNNTVLDSANLGRLSDFSKQIAYLINQVTTKDFEEKIPTEIFSLFSVFDLTVLKAWAKLIVDFFDNKENINLLKEKMKEKGTLDA